MSAPSDRAAMVEAIARRVLDDGYAWTDAAGRAEDAAFLDQVAATLRRVEQYALVLEVDRIRLLAAPLAVLAYTAELAPNSGNVHELIGPPYMLTNTSALRLTVQRVPS